MKKNIMNTSGNQGFCFLSDKKKNGKERPWKDKKEYACLLSESYERLSDHEQLLAKVAAKDAKHLDAVADKDAFRAHGEAVLVREADSKHWYSRYSRVCGCAMYLVFRLMPDGSKKLYSAHFCQVRLCPVCGWRRELKIKSQLSQVVDVAEKERYRFIFLTLTCKNVAGEELQSSLDMMFGAYHKMFRLKQVKESVAGHFRALEITHDIERTITKKMYQDKKAYYDRLGLNVGDINPNFNMYHPHFHVMMIVKSNYFRESGKYISHDKWQSMWKQSLRVDYNPMVNVKVVSNKNGGGVKETAKYTAKETDYIIKEDKPLTDETVRILDKALRNRRLVAYGGIMKTIHKRLNLDEDVSADVHIEGEEENVREDALILQEYAWNVGFKNYVMVPKKDDQ